LFYFTAIIGSGIGGTSCAYFLKEMFKDLVNLDIYEGNKVGGRLATVIMSDGNEYETGGSVIHQRNRYMSNFVTNLGKLSNVHIALSSECNKFYLNQDFKNVCQYLKMNDLVCIMEKILIL